MLRSSALAVALAAPLVAQVVEVEFTREVYPASGITCHGDWLWQTYRVIDGITGAPIAGAEMLLIDESNAPIRGEFWFRHRAVGDADGFVRFRRPEGEQDWHWVLLRAPGYGAAMDMGSFDSAVVSLAVAQDVPVQVRDPFGRPVPDVLVGFCCGCGHTPDLAHARTGAGGVAVLQGIDLHNGIHDIYVEHPALHLGYHSIRWFPGDPSAPFWPGPGVPQYGVVVDSDGQPVAGVPVGFPDVHRGPWTRTAADGSFGLFGLDSPSDLFVVLEDRRVEFDLPPEMPYRLQLPEPDGYRTQVVVFEEPDQGEAGDPVRFEFVIDSERPLGTVGFRLTGPLPRRDVTDGESDGGSIVELPEPGRYELRVVCDDHREFVCRVEATAGGENQVRARLEPLPAVLVRVERLPEGAWVELLTGDDERDITEYVREGRPVGIDDRVPVWIVLCANGGARRVLPFAPGVATHEPELELSWYEPTMLLGRLVDHHGELVPARVAVVPIGSGLRGFDPRELEETIPTAGSLTVPAGSFGLTMLAVLPVDDALAPRLLTMSLPERGDGQEFELGDVRLLRTPRLTVLGADSARFLRSGWSDVRDRDPLFPIDRGRWLGPDPRAGDAIVIPGARPEGEAGLVVRDLPYRTVLAGDGPWTVRPPAGELLVDVRSADGGSVGALVLFDDQEVEVDERTLLRRVSPGKKTVFISAEDRQTAIVRVTVPTTGRAELEVTLPRR